MTHLARAPKAYDPVWPRNRLLQGVPPPSLAPLGIGRVAVEHNALDVDVQERVLVNPACAHVHADNVRWRDGDRALEVLVALGADKNQLWRVGAEETADERRGHALRLPAAVAEFCDGEELVGRWVQWGSGLTHGSSTTSSSSACPRRRWGRGGEGRTRAERTAGVCIAGQYLATCGTMGRSPAKRSEGHS